MASHMREDPIACNAPLPSKYKARQEIIKAWRLPCKLVLGYEVIVSIIRMMDREPGAPGRNTPAREFLPEVRMKGSATRWTAWSNAFVIAAATLWAHKLRSLLTVFGIVIGIAAVVLAGATLLSVRDLAVRSTAQSFGVNTLIVSQAASVGNLTR